MSFKLLCKGGEFVVVCEVCGCLVDIGVVFLMWVMWLVQERESLPVNCVFFFILSLFPLCGGCLWSVTGGGSVSELLFPYNIFSWLLPTARTPGLSTFMDPAPPTAATKLPMIHKFARNGEQASSPS